MSLRSASAPLALLAMAFTSSAASSASMPDWAHAPRVDVALSNFRFAPQALRLKAGQPIMLHLTNMASGGHNFSAPGFFRSAVLRPQDVAKVKDGLVDVAGHQGVDIALVPAAGEYPLRCTHMFHTTFGMKGTITVE